MRWKISGILTLILLLAVAGGIYYYVSYNKQQGYHYYGIYDRVKGLQEADPVMLRGVKIGHVSGIRLRDDKKIQVDFWLKKDCPLPRGSKAVIGNTNLSGDNHVYIELGKSREILPKGSEIKASTDTSMMELFHEKISPVLDNARFLLGLVDTALVNFSQQVIVNGIGPNIRHAVEEAHTTLGNTEKISGDLLRESDHWLALFSSANTYNDKPRRLNQTINQSLDSFLLLTQSLKNIAFDSQTHQLHSSLQSIRSSFREIEGSFASSESRQELSKINNQIDSLGKAAASLQQNPPVFSIFGKKKKK